MRFVHCTLLNWRQIGLVLDKQKGEAFSLTSHPRRVSQQETARVCLRHIHFN